MKTDQELKSKIKELRDIYESCGDKKQLRRLKMQIEYNESILSIIQNFSYDILISQKIKLEAKIKLLDERFWEFAKESTLTLNQKRKQFNNLKYITE